MPLPPPRRLFALPFIAAILTAIVKSVYLCSAILLLPSVGAAFQVLVGDLFLIGVVASLTGVTPLFPVRLLRALAGCLTLLVCIWYIADTAILMAIESRLSVDQIVVFSSEWKLIATFVSFRAIVLSVLFAALGFYNPSVHRAHLWSLTLAGAALTLIGLTDHFVSPVYEKYSSGPRALRAALRSEVNTGEPYSDADANKARLQFANQTTIDLPEGQPNVILLVVESLSSIDMVSMGGSQELMPELDRIAKRGVSYTNFFANHTYSAGGLVALLNGVPPVPFPNAVRSMHRSFHRVSSMPAVFQKNGYRTTLLLGFDREMLHLYEWAQNIGFSDIVGSNELPQYKDVPRHALGAIPDHLLLEAAAQTVATRFEEKAPFFLTILTGSTHRPYIHPLGGSNTERGLFNYLDSEIAKFFRFLESKDFFSNGILIVTGDHRKMIPVAEEERRRWGDSAAARIPLIVVGSGVPAGVANERYFQQSDLFRKLRRSFEPSNLLSPSPIFVSNWMSFSRAEAERGNVIVFSEAAPNKGFALSAYGSLLQWQGEKPSDAEARLAELHEMRAALQSANTRSEIFCAFPTALTPPISGSGPVVESLWLGNVLDKNDPNVRPLFARRIGSMSVVSEVNAANIPSAGLSQGYQTTISVPEAGYYWFRLITAEDGCLSLDSRSLFSTSENIFAPKDESGVRFLDAQVYLEAHLPHQITVLHRQDTAAGGMKLYWRPPGRLDFQPIPTEWLTERKESRVSAVPPTTPAS